MGVVLVNVLTRYGLTWSFEPEFNSHIAVFVGSIAGALFTLTNAVLLFAALQAQRNAQEDASAQHQALRQDRNYERLIAQADRLETGIAAYVVQYETHTLGSIDSAPSFHSYSGLSKTFEIWIVECLANKIAERLAMADRIDPDMYLTHQVEAMDLMYQLEALIQSVKATDIDVSGKEHLSKRVSTVLTRLARSKKDLQSAALLLRRFVDQGDSAHPKQHYASDLLHLERKIRDIVRILPDMPYRNLSPFEDTQIALTKEAPLVMFESHTVPTFQIDVVKFTTKDSNWKLRFNRGRLTVQVVAVDEQGEQLNYLFQPFSFAVLLFDAEQDGHTFDTKGRWYVEGAYNLMAGNVEDHKIWRIDVTYVDIELLADEALEVTLYTNASIIASGAPILR